VVIKLDILGRFTPKNKLCHPMVGGWVFPSQSEHFGEEKILLPLLGLEPWIIQPVA
jgi:hypothetical protein